MNLNETVSYGAASPADAFALLTDEGFRGEMCEKVHALSHDVSVVPSGASVTVTITRVMPAQMPDFVRKLVGETVEVVQTERWAAPDANGDRKADVTVTIVGQPAEMIGTSALTGTSAGTSYTLNGEVKVKIPFVGRKIEPEIAKAILAALRIEASEARKRLDA